MMVSSLHGDSWKMLRTIQNQLDYDYKYNRGRHQQRKYECKIIKAVSGDAFEEEYEFRFVGSRIRKQANASTVALP